MPRIDSTTRLCGLIGRGIGYTLSPAIHNYVFDLTGFNAVYLAFDLSENIFDRAAAGLVEIAFGLNVTIPYKEKILRYIEGTDPIASKIGAINTIYNKTGYNTDYLAIKQLVEEKIGRLSGAKCLVFGAGGAAKAASYALGDLGCEIYIINRTKARAEELAQRMKSYGYHAEVIQECSNIKQEIVVNATPEPSSIPRSCIEGTAAIDLVYRPVKTYLIDTAEKRNMITINGLQILVRGALHSQSIWQQRDLTHLEDKVVDYLYAGKYVW
ncbi:MAG TPA: shikimate dehydrogenase [Sulfolobales archaeon]|nr:shikimate dehydrogenase [Sulfolobales archaeon]